MGVIQRQSIKSTIYNYIGVLVGFLYTGLLMPHYLSEGEIGALSLIVTYSIILAQLASLGFNNVTIRFFPFFKDDAAQKRKFLFLGFAVVAFGCSLVSLLFLLIKPLIIQSNLEDSPIFTTYLFLIWPVFLFLVIFNLLDAYARSIYYSTIGAFLREFVQRMLILGVIILAVYQLINQSLLFTLYAVALASPTVLLIVFLLYKNEFKLQPEMPKIEPAMRRDMARLAGFSIITGFATLAVLQIDSIMVNQFLNEEATGVYRIVFFFGTLVIMPSRAVQRIAPSVVARSFKENDLPNIAKIYHKSCLTMFAIGQLILLGLWLNIDNIFRILPEEYEIGKYVILLIGSANLVNMVAGISSEILANSRYYAYSAWFVGVLVVITVISNFIFIPLWGISGAAFASLVSMLVFAITKYAFLNRKFGFQPYNANFLLLLLMGILTYFIVVILPVFDNLYLNVLWVSGITALIYLAMIYFSGIIPEANQIIDRFFGKKMK